jgi:2-dehydro-3-deoxyphosphooctonate aldolase (KDO 8-P synthase)
MKTVKAGNVSFGNRKPMALIAGPCVIESRKGCLQLAKKLKALAEAEGIPLVFKASYDKANRSSIDSYRGPGLEEGLKVLYEVKEETGLPVLTDVHDEMEASAASEVVDILQIPAFLCRQTDLLLAAGETGKIINIKKGQFMAPEDMGNVVKKVESTGNRNILLTERGASFGYNNLVADMRSLIILRDFGYPVIFDATHSVQRPGGAGDRTSGDGQWAPLLSRAAAGVGCEGIFMETHLNPLEALSDRDNAVKFSKMKSIWKDLSGIDEVTRGKRGLS